MVLCIRSESALMKVKSRLERPDVIAFNSAFRACAFADAAHVQRLLRLMRQNAAEPDVVTSNTLISSYSRQLAWEESLAGVVQGRGNYPVFSSIACNAALSSLGFESNWPTSLALLEDVQMKGKADVVSFGAAMTALARASQSRLSLKLLDSLDDDLTNEQIYSAAISSCEGESCWKSVDLLKQARHRQVRLDVTVYGAACNVCEKGNFWESSDCLIKAVSVCLDNFPFFDPFVFCLWSVSLTTPSPPKRHIGTNSMFVFPCLAFLHPDSLMCLFHQCLPRNRPWPCCRGPVRPTFLAARSWRMLRCPPVRRATCGRRRCNSFKEGRERNGTSGVGSWEQESISLSMKYMRYLFEESAMKA